MKNLRKLLALVLTLALALSLAIPAFAAGDETDTTPATGSITITPKDNGDHTFTAYQIFDGELSASGVLSNVEWGSNVSDQIASELITKLKEIDSTFTKSGDVETTAVKDYFVSCTTAATVAEALDKLITDASEEVAAEALTGVLGSLNLSGGTALEKDSTSQKYTVSNLPVGYYMVTDSVTQGATGAKASDMILRVVGNVVVDAKADIPQVTKKAANDFYGIGDEITYTLTATVPDYNKSENDDTYTYKLVFTDTMNTALDLIYTYTAHEGEPNSGITVKMGETDVTNSFTIRYDKTSHKLTVSCDNICEINGVSNESVFTVTYNAKINNTYTSGEVDNKVTLVTKDYTSIEIVENVFPVQLKVVKVDGADEKVKLEGAQFTLQNESGKYLQVNDDGKVNGWVEENEASMLVTDDKGEINVTGLAVGTYTLTETVAPDGYNLAASPFTLVISAEVNQAGDALDKLTISVDGATAVNGADGVVTAIIANNKGAQLPSTGGIGTTIFYVIGAILVIGAGVLLITKKRMSNAQ